MSKELKLNEIVKNYCYPRMKTINPLINVLVVRVERCVCQWFVTSWYTWVSYMWNLESQ